ncbi:MAG: hypothetical protein KJ822_05775 [Proteobacteria bacterium]|nr:hypothetical protein [Pseudomonadota bacterium]
MNGGRRSGWQRIGAAFWGLGAVLLLLGVAAPSEAAGGISAEKIQELLWRTVNFVVFAGILVYLLAKPAKKFFAKRSQDVPTTLEEMAAKQAEFEAAVAAAEARLAAVAKERQNVIQQFIAEGEMEKAKILDKANLVAARIKEMAAFTIEQETKKAAQSLKEEVVGLATQMATDMIKEKATYTDQQGLVEEYLKKVVETH